MYAFSTTTYIGFQAVMDEEMTENFRGLPGVLFVLPDAYLGYTKEYGGLYHSYFSCFWIYYL